jgi:hypothetical protein
MPKVTEQIYEDAKSKFLTLHDEIKRTEETEDSVRVHHQTLDGHAR